MSGSKVALIVGAGEATGGAIARRFPREGFTACVTRRDAGKLKPLVDRIAAEGGEARELGPEGIHVARQLHVQSRSAWTHELDLRPWMETW